jgi:hypothetical protein
MRWLLLLLSVFVLGCGSSSDADARSADDAEENEEAEHAGVTTDDPSVSGSIPRRCAKGRKYRKECVPPPGWVRRLCEDVYPDVALHMFRPETPWKRLYMVANAEPFNASGGASLLGDKMRRGEEVIALKRRSGQTGVQVGDTAGYDVLRWNGACATIHDGDFTTEKPRNVVYSKLEWRQFSLPLRNALEAEPDVSAAYEARRKACKGRNLGIVAEECESNDKALVEEIVRFVQSGANLPRPNKMP